MCSTENHTRRSSPVNTGHNARLRHRTAPNVELGLIGEVDHGQDEEQSEGQRAKRLSWVHGNPKTGSSLDRVDLG